MEGAKVEILRWGHTSLESCSNRCNLHSWEGRVDQIHSSATTRGGGQLVLAFHSNWVLYKQVRLQVLEVWGWSCWRWWTINAGKGVMARDLVLTGAKQNKKFHTEGLPKFFTYERKLGASNYHRGPTLWSLQVCYWICPPCSMVVWWVGCGLRGPYFMELLAYNQLHQLQRVAFMADQKAATFGALFSHGMVYLDTTESSTIE